MKNNINEQNNLEGSVSQFVKTKFNLLKIKNIEWAFLIGIVVTIVISSIIQFGKSCDNIRNEILRFHIMANSNDIVDQNLKLAVRDRILSETADIFNDADNKNYAENNILNTLKTVENIAADEIKSQGYKYSVNAELTKMYFTTRTYENITLPAGNYNAMRITIGDGVGDNWWCVLYPPLCVPAAVPKKELEDVLSPSEEIIVNSNPQYETRFFIIEWFEWIKSKF